MSSDSCHKMMLLESLKIPLTAFVVIQVSKSVVVLIGYYSEVLSEYVRKNLGVRKKVKFRMHNHS